MVTKKAARNSLWTELIQRQEDISVALKVLDDPEAYELKQE